jgi:hypothetical protein
MAQRGSSVFFFKKLPVIDPPRGAPFGAAFIAK